MAIRVGIIGTGFGAAVHAPILQKHPDYDVVAISSIRAGRARQIGDELGIPFTYDEWPQMLSDSLVDLVVIASNPEHHMEMALVALERIKRRGLFQSAG